MWFIVNIEFINALHVLKIVSIFMVSCLSGSWYKNKQITYFSLLRYIKLQIRKTVIVAYLDLEYWSASVVWYRVEVNFEVSSWNYISILDRCVPLWRWWWDVMIIELDFGLSNTLVSVLATQCITLGRLHFSSGS